MLPRTLRACVGRPPYQELRLKERLLGARPGSPRRRRRPATLTRRASPRAAICRGDEPREQHLRRFGYRVADKVDAIVEGLAAARRGGAGGISPSPDAGSRHEALASRGGPRGSVRAEGAVGRAERATARAGAPDRCHRAVSARHRARLPPSAHRGAVGRAHDPRSVRIFIASTPINMRNSIAPPRHDRARRSDGARPGRAPAGRLLQLGESVPTRCCRSPRMTV